MFDGVAVTIGCISRRLKDREQGKARCNCCGHEGVVREGFLPSQFDCARFGVNWMQSFGIYFGSVPDEWFQEHLVRPWFLAALDWGHLCRVTVAANLGVGGVE